MKKERINLSYKELTKNAGQIDWLPSNPRTWTADDVRRTEASIQEDPDFLEDRPLLVVVDVPGNYVVFAGNLRCEAVTRLKMRAVPCVLYTPEGPEDELAIVRRAMKDNGSFGSWDYDALGNEWGDLPLKEWGVPTWESEKAGVPGHGLSSEGKEGAGGYDAFVDKFKAKLTTDDCYTPAPIYDAVVAWVESVCGPIDRAKIVRPFFPGGDYQRADYPDGCIVIDNPPFSIYAEIVRWYLDHGVRFFLFGPHLTLKVRGADVTYVVCGQGVTYENGAVVNTSFVTNVPELEDYRIYISTALYRSIGEVDHELQKKADLGRYKRPAELWTIPVLSKIAKGEVDFGIKKEECEEVSNIECLKEMGKSLFGGGISWDQQRREKQRREKQYP